MLSVLWYLLLHLCPGLSQANDTMTFSFMFSQHLASTTAISSLVAAASILMAVTVNVILLPLVLIHTLEKDHSPELFLARRLCMRTNIVNIHVQDSITRVVSIQHSIIQVSQHLKH
jgi:hypothetical protein